MNKMLNTVLVLGAFAAPALAAPPSSSGGNAGGNGNGNGHAAAGTAVILSGIARDFRAANTSGGHPDFGGVDPAQGRGVYAGIAADHLDAEGNPVFATTGHKVTTGAVDSSARPIIGDKDHIEKRSGDTNCVALTAEGQAVASAASFADWYRDNPIVNMSAPFNLPMVESSEGVRTFDGDLRTQFMNATGFGGNKVFGYTFEIETRVWVTGGQQTLTFGADDAVWVYVNDKLVIDLGGNHDFTEQTIDLSRLEGITESAWCNLKIFYAERDKSGSHFKMQVTGPMMRVVAPPTGAQWD